MANRVYKLVAGRRLGASLRLLYAEGIRLPVFRIGDYAFALHPESGRMFVTLGNRRLGTVLASGIFRPVKEGISLVALHFLLKIMDDPLSAVRLISGVLPEPRCAVCKIPLGPKSDRRRGIGKKCYEKGEFWRLEKETTVARPRSSKIGTRRKRR